MKRRTFNFLTVLSLLFLDSSGLILAFQMAYATRFHSAAFTSLFPVTKGVPPPSLYRGTLFAMLPVWLMVFVYLGLYRDVLVSAYDEFIRISKGVILCALLTTAITFGYRASEYSRLAIGLWGIYSLVFLYLLREGDKRVFRILQTRSLGREKFLMIGKGSVSDVIQEMAQRKKLALPVFLDHLPAHQPFRDYLQQRDISEVLLIQGSMSSEDLMETARVCEALSIDCRIVPDLLELRRGEIIVDGFLGLPTFRIKPLSLHGTNYYLKRSFDVVVSILVLTILGFPLFLISVLIWCDSSGPILYTQKRMGLRGQEFKLFKFRTMVINADEMLKDLKHKSDRAGPVFKMKEDPRITRVGRWLRQYSLDEIPQILNVMRGDMSLVGPRPQVLWEAAHYDDHARKRLRVVPGITGLWQVSGRAALSYEEMINLDIFYLENWSLGLDLKILLRTLPAIFAGEGAY